MSRSGSPYSTPRDANRVPLLVAASTADGVTPIVLEANPITHALVTTNSSGNNLVGIDPVGQSGVTYDTIAYTNTSSTVDTYTYKSGGTGGTTTATITITYTDTSKTQISTVVRT